jgi:acyl-coenzyme A thioesterase PaaI-like protein
MPSPKEIVNVMMAEDYFSQWLGIEVLEITEGNCRLKMQIKKNMFAIRQNNQSQKKTFLLRIK